MHSLSQSTGKPPEFVEKLVSNWKKICVLGPLASIIYMCIIILPECNERTRISENALLPALVTEHFGHQQRIYASLKALYVENDVVDYVERELKNYGLSTQLQHFRTEIKKYPVSGTNVIGVVHASRSPSVEAILLAVALEKQNINAMATALALASHCREQLYWARDIIFVFIDRGITGMTAFLDAYHGYNRPLLNSTQLHYHSGVIVGAFALKADGSIFDTLSIEYNMVNGLLPNLDLFNLVVKLADKFALDAQIHNSGRERQWWDFAQTTSSAMISQAFDTSQGLHSVFGLYGIQALTVHAKSLEYGHSTLADLARVCEGILRSLNNILEKFHQSYFLYILPDARHFISVAYYMPPFGLLLSPLVVQVLRDWFSMKEFGLPRSYVTLHVVQYLAFLLLRSLALSPSNYYFADYASLLSLVPYYLFLPLSEGKSSLVRFLLCMEYCLVFGSLALLNFSLAYIISLFAVPIIVVFAILETPRWLDQLKKVIGPLLHPLAIYFLCKYFWLGTLPSFESLLHLSSELMRSHLLIDSFLYPFLFVCVLPLWNVLLQVTNAIVK